MKIISTKFSGLKVIESKIFKDTRGFFKEDFKKKFFLGKKFVFGCTSTSKKNVVRGLHLQTKFPQGKYVSVLKGAIFDVAVDLRKNSKTFGKYFKIILSNKNSKLLFVPKGFAHGFRGLDSENIVVYFCSNYRYKQGEKSIIWNDKKLNINWGIKKPIISKKDSNAVSFEEYFSKAYNKI